MNEFDLIVRFKSDENSITLRNYIIDHLFEDKLFDNLQMWDFKRSEVLSIVNLQKENAELKIFCKKLIKTNNELRNSLRKYEIVPDIDYLPNGNEEYKENIGDNPYGVK